ncbi:MAG: TIGR01212 family radical SAM protein [Thermoflexaceae bacterium]|nr:TIGR01212 family radical SAM protein [Thermoflexaceae bacterium]
MKHYYSLNDYSIEKFGRKVYKIALNGNMSCPNRDGSIGHKGCIFCSEGGSGDFAESAFLSVTEQLEAGKRRLSQKYKGSSYIAYFQAYTNTYASVEYLEKIFTEAIMHPDVVCLSIATRPDCLDKDKLALLARLNRIKPVWVELGLQTIHEPTASYIRRGYDLSVFDSAMDLLNNTGIETIVHMIIGLPNEDKEMMLKTADYIGHSGAKGIKLQLLHVLKNTDLACDYEKGRFSVLSLEEYTDILMDIIKLLPPDMVIHLLTGDGPKKLLIAPQWSADKKHVLNTINKTLSKQNIIQGTNYIL